MLKRLFRLLLWAALGAALLLGAVILSFVIWPPRLDLSFSGSAPRHNAARRDFMTELENDDCLTRARIISAAQDRGWEWRDEPEVRWCHAPAGLDNWLRVTVSPPLAFSTDDENAAFFGFDAGQCIVPWSYTSGPGSTCP